MAQDIVDPDVDALGDLVTRDRGRAKAVESRSAPARGMLPILFIFLASGAAGLVYEVVWSRQLVLLFGNTTQAVSAILTGFFGGMAIGSVVGGWLADRTRSPLRLYALLEVCLATVALLTPALFRLANEVYRAEFGGLENTPLLLALVRMGLALLALGPATILMGATLPTLSRYLARRNAEFGGAFARLYAVNTLGAIVGAALAGYVLIELLGLRATLIVGAACSYIAGIAAWLLAQRFGKTRSASSGMDSPNPLMPSSEPSDSGDSAPRELHPRLAIGVAFVSGLTSLGYQTLWTRLLSSGTGNSTYVFTTILTVFLVGIGLGATVYALTASRWHRPVALLGVLQIGVAFIAIAGLGVVTQAFTTDDLITQALVAVLPATIVMGLTFPLSSSLIADRDERLGTSAGLLLGANTLGAIVGTFVVPFVAIPAIGSPRSVVVLALVNAVLGGALILRARGMRRTQQSLAATAAGSLAVVAVAGLVIGLPITADPNLNRMNRAQGVVVLHSAEDEIASVQSGTVARSPQLWVGGNSMTVLSVDARLMSVLPVMLRPQARSMLVIAFGMGSSYRQGLREGLQVEGVELVPSVPRLFGDFYSDAAAVLADPNGHLRIADGRNHVELTGASYDVVVVDPPPPIRSSGTAVLYSREFYTASLRRLTPGGVMMEWMPYDQSVEEFRAHARTFASVFRHMLFAFGPGNNGVFMFGSDAPLAFDQGDVQQVLARNLVAADLSEPPDAPVRTPAAWATEITTLPWIADEQVLRFGGSGPLITDDQPLTEYFLLRTAFGPPSPPMKQASLLAATPK